MKKKVKKFYITIPKAENENNSKNDQFHYYQHDGETVAVAVGVRQEVPEWVAKRAKEIGEVDDYFEFEVEED